MFLIVSSLLGLLFLRKLDDCRIVCLILNIFDRLGCRQCNKLHKHLFLKIALAVVMCELVFR